MRLLFCKTNWEIMDAPLDAFLARTRADGFDGAELNVLAWDEPPDEVAGQLQAHSLDLVAQVFTDGETPDDHLRSLETQVEAALPCRPLLVNCHAGRDYFSFEDNVRIFERVVELSRATGVRLCVETHRGRPTYSAPETRRYLERLPDLMLNADFSHWTVVHESDLGPHEPAVAEAITRSGHIHARVGYEQGPQVNDPRAPEWATHVTQHVARWQRIAEHQRRQGAEHLTITPEFGPPPYAPTLPFTRVPVTDVWAVNVYMKDLLKRELQPAPEA